MAIDCNGTTSQLTNTTATGFSHLTLSIAAWIRPDTIGESGGRVIQCGEASADGTIILLHAGSANNLQFNNVRNSGNAGAWTCPIVDGAWSAVAVSFNGGSIANDPVMRVNFASAAATEISTPSDNPAVPGAGYCIGNRAEADRTWDGALAHLQYFNVILTAEEMDAALYRPGSIRRGLHAWWPLHHATYLAQLVGGGPAAGTATALTTRDGPPCAPLAA